MTTSRAYGGRSFSRGEIYKLLANPIYVGEIKHKGERYEGQHPAIIDRQTWDEVRARLAANTHARHIRQGARDPSLLAGLLHDDQGNRLTPTHAVKTGKRYRYYALQPSDAQVRKRGRPQETERRWRIAATEIEAVVIRQLARQLEDQHWLLAQCLVSDDTIQQRKTILANGRALADRVRSDDPAGKRELLMGLLARVTLAEAEVRLDIRRSGLLAALGVVGEISGEAGHESDQSQNDRPNSSQPQSGSQVDEESVTVIIPTRLRRRGAETRLIIRCTRWGRPAF